MYRSSKKYYLTFKYLFLFLSGVFLLLFTLINQSIIEVKKEDINFSQVVMIALSLICSVLFYFLRNKFAIVEIRKENIKIIKGSKIESHEWNNITNIKQLQFITPPLYKVEFMNGQDSVFFSTGANYISINGFVKDISSIKKHLDKLEQRDPD